MHVRQNLHETLQVLLLHKEVRVSIFELVLQYQSSVSLMYGVRRGMQDTAMVDADGFVSLTNLPQALWACPTAEVELGACISALPIRAWYALTASYCRCRGLCSACTGRMWVCCL